MVMVYCGDDVIGLPFDKHYLWRRTIENQGYCYRNIEVVIWKILGQRVFFILYISKHSSSVKQKISRSLDGDFNLHCTFLLCI